jgi:hypothetical protein
MIEIRFFYFFPSQWIGVTVRGRGPPFLSENVIFNFFFKCDFDQKRTIGNSLKRIIQYLANSFN